jgi:ubiquinol-cytochrome c reductase cytochrome b subunit
MSGAAILLRSDPKTQGPKLFAKNCAVCHRFDGLNGAGRPVMEVKDGNEVEAVATATDLGKFGSREWIRGVLTDFKTHFKATENARFNGEPVGDHFTAGKMAEWSGENAGQLKPEELNALVEFLVAQGARPDVPPADPQLAATGKEIFELGTDSVTVSCTACHSMHAKGDDAPLEGGGKNAPNLTGYASEAWLKSFIRNPGSDENYGKHNAMPGFADTLSETELQLLTDWMLHRWYEAPTTAAHAVKDEPVAEAAAK